MSIRMSSERIEDEEAKYAEYQLSQSAFSRGSLNISLSWDLIPESTSKRTIQDTLNLRRGNIVVTAKQHTVRG
jgi:hypothetical protein